MLSSHGFARAHRLETSPAAVARLLLALCLAIQAPFSPISSMLSAEESFPYPAATIRNYCLVRSAPSDGAYPTTRLRKGLVLEVHRHAPGGWRGVRPPEGSFSWIRLRDLHISPGSRLARVARDGVTPWVGSQIHEVNSPFWQVRLKEGEVVEVLGERRLTSSNGDVAQVWCKIAPPAGEFRWIHAYYLSAVQPKGARGDERDIEPARSSRPQPTPKPDLRREPPPEIQQTRFQQKPSTETEKTPTKQPDEPPTRFAIELKRLTKDFERALQAKNRLGRPLGAESRWSDLQRRAAKLVEQGATPLDRGRARLLHERILKQAPRAQNIEGPTDVDPLAAADAAPLPPPISRAAPDLGEAASDAEAPNDRTDQPQGVKDDAPIRYDGVGWLQPVLSSTPLPPFALTDVEGRILHYVVPAPGFNLRRYAKQRVGVFGRRGVSQRYKTRVLVAQRVVVLKK